MEEITPGITVGFGEGTTARLALMRTAELLKEGRLQGIRVVPCSERLLRRAQAMGIPLTTLQERPVVDLTIDGADEVSPDLQLIKGRGGALLREKIMAQASRRELIVVDETKLSPGLGVRAPVPVEIVPFGWRTQASHIESLGGRISVRTDGRGRPWLTDQRNMIIDAAFGAIERPRSLAAALDARAGIVAHGLFIDLDIEIIVAGQGGLRILRTERLGTCPQ